MFYVNDTDGLKFEGTLEKLEEWGKVIRKRSVPTTKKQEDSSSSNFSSPQKERAITAYQQYLAKDKGMLEPLVHAYQIMSSPVDTVFLETDIIEAWDLMQEKSVKQVIAIDEKRKVLGQLSERDILSKLNIVNNQLQLNQNFPVADILNREVICTHSISDIRRIARVLAKFHVDAMPVIEDEMLIGIVTRGDILRGFAENPKLNLYA